MTRSPADRPGYIEHAVETSRILHGDGLPFDEAFVRKRAAGDDDRSDRPDGAATRR